MVAAIFSSLALAFALVVGFGSRPVATEIASGRALRRLVSPGDTIESPSVAGTIVAMHPTAVEIDHEGNVSLVPNTQLLDGSFTIERPEIDDN